MALPRWVVVEVSDDGENAELKSLLMTNFSKLSSNNIKKCINDNDKSILEYITEKRMKEAKRLLTETSYSIEKIANLSGYRTPHYFGQKFKETYGYTPTYYREIIRKQGEKCDV